MKQYLLFQVAENMYAMETTGVVKVISMRPITKIPNAPHDIRGIIHLEERIIVVIDLRRRWHYEAKEEDLKTSIMITNDNEQWIGWIVDAVNKVMFFEEEQLLTIPWGKIVQEMPLVNQVIRHEGELVSIISIVNLIGSGGKVYENS